MSNLWLNLRVVYWHLQIGRDRPHITIKRNEWRWKNKLRWPLIDLH